MHDGRVTHWKVAQEGKAITMACGRVKVAGASRWGQMLHDSNPLGVTCRQCRVVINCCP